MRVGWCGGFLVNLLRLDGSLGVAVRRQSFHIDFGYGEFIGYVVRVLDGRRLRETFTQGGLFAQHLSQCRVAVFAVTSVQSLSECVYHTDLYECARDGGASTIEGLGAGGVE